MTNPDPGRQVPNATCSFFIVSRKHSSKLMVLAHFHDVTDDKIWFKKAGPHLKHSFMCSAPKNSYFTRRTYSDTSAELMEAHVGLTSFEHVQNRYYMYNSEQPVNVPELLKSPA